jgi:hypothetical protein
MAFLSVFGSPLIVFSGMLSMHHSTVKNTLPVCVLKVSSNHHCTSAQLLCSEKACKAGISEDIAYLA